METLVDLKARHFVLAHFNALLAGKLSWHLDCVVEIGLSVLLP